MGRRENFVSISRNLESTKTKATFPLWQSWADILLSVFHYYLKVSLRNAYEKGKISNIYDIFQLDSRSVSKTKEPDSSAYRKKCISSSLNDPFCCIGIGFFLHILVKLEDQSKIEEEEVENKQPIMKTKQETTPQKARHSKKYPTAYLKKISQEMAKDEDDDNSNDAVLRKRILISTFCLSFPSLRSIDWFVKIVNKSRLKSKKRFW